LEAREAVAEDEDLLLRCVVLEEEGAGFGVALQRASGASETRWGGGARWRRRGRGSSVVEDE